MSAWAWVCCAYGFMFVLILPACPIADMTVSKLKAVAVGGCGLAVSCSSIAGLMFVVVLLVLDSGDMVCLVSARCSLALVAAL